LSVFNRFGEHYTRSSVLLRQDGDPEPQRPYAEWMPYQTAQAASLQAEKTEAQNSGQACESLDSGETCFGLASDEGGPIHLIQAPNIIINAHNVYLERD
jgi:hypothetical protein